jgi:soluble lytic murein transglycosylase-like protein
MKLNKLPKMVILKPFASIPKITESRTFKVIKYSAYTIIAVAMIVSVMYLNIIREQVLFLQKPVATAEQTDVLVINETATIIARDGNLPLAVAKKYAVWVYEAAAKYAVDPILLVAVMATESKFDYKAVSPAGPIGLFQITAFWHKDKTTSAQLFDPHHNILVGAQIIKQYKDMSSSTTETLLRYNGSLGEAPSYALKVLNTKKRYDTEIMKAVAL